MPAGFGAAGISPQGESEFGSTKDLPLTNSEQSQFPGALLLGKESQARLIRATAKGRCTGATVSLAGDGDVPPSSCTAPLEKPQKRPKAKESEPPNWDCCHQQQLVNRRVGKKAQQLDPGI